APRAPPRRARAERPAAASSVAVAPAARAVPGAPAELGAGDGGAAAARRGGFGGRSARRPGAPRSHLILAPAVDVLGLRFFLRALAGHLLPPPALPGFGQQVDGIVVLVLARQRLRIVLLDPGPVVLRPVGDALLVVVLRDLVHPALPHEGYVADDARGGEPREIPHDVVLELLRLGHAR